MTFLGVGLDALVNGKNDWGFETFIEAAQARDYLSAIWPGNEFERKRFGERLRIVEINVTA
jgi:hypothetical protein